MTCKQCKNYDECKFDAACNDAVFDPDVSAEYCTGAEPITNADRIRAMSDEDFAEYLIQYRDDWGDYGTPNGGFFDTHEEAKEETVKWLQQPAGE